MSRYANEILLEQSKRKYTVSFTPPSLQTQTHVVTLCQRLNTYLTPSPDQVLIFEEDIFSYPNWGGYRWWKRRREENKNLKVEREWPCDLHYILTSKTPEAAGSREHMHDTAG